MANPDEVYTKRMDGPRQDLSDAYSLPANFLEIEVANPESHGIGWRQKYTDYEVKLKTNLPVFKHKEFSVRRRYSDFEWLVNELERDSKIVVPSLPGKALKMQLPFRNDDGLFSDEFIEERRKGLEVFINKIHQAEIIIVKHLIQGRNNVVWVGVKQRSCDHGRRCNDASTHCTTLPTYRVAGHPLAQNEKCLHMFLQENTLDKNYTPGKIRNA